MEKQILLVNAIEIHSKKNGNDYYLIEYVDLKANKNKSLIKNVDDWTEQNFKKFESKVKKGEAPKYTGIFEANDYDTLELVDLK